MAARKARTTTAAATETVDLRKAIIAGLAEAGLKAKAKDAPSKKYAVIYVDGTSVGMTFAQTRNGVRVLVKVKKPGDLPRTVKGFKPSKRTDGFGAAGGFDERTVTHAIAAFAHVAKRQADAAAKKATARA